MKLQANRTGAVLSVGLLCIATAFAARPLPEPPLIISEDSLSLDDLVEIALENQALYQKAVADEDLSRYSIRGAYGEFLPTLGIGGTFQSSRAEFERTTPTGEIITSIVDWSSTSSIGAQLSEDIFLGGSRFFRLKGAKLRKKNAYLITRATQDQVIYTVKSAAYLQLSALKFREVALEVLEQRRENLRLAQTRFNTGDAIELDVLQAQIDVGTQESVMLRAKQAVENTREALNLALGAHLDSRFPIDAELTPALPGFELEELVDFALDSSPNYRIQLNAVEIRKQEVISAMSDFLPNISFNAGFSRSVTETGQSKFTLNPEFESRYFTFNVGWYAFNRFRTDINRQSAVIEKRKAMWDARDQKFNLSASLHRQWRNLTLYYEQVQVAEKNRELARRQLDMERERYRIGASDRLNLRNAQVTFIQAENDHIAGILDFFTTLAALERDLGRPLEEVPQ